MLKVTCMCVCPVISDSVTPWTVALQAPLSMEFPRQEHWTGLLSSSRRGLPDPGFEPMSPALAGRFFTTKPPGKPMEYYSAMKRNKFESVLVSWMNQEPVIQSELSQREENRYCI